MEVRSISTSDLDSVYRLLTNHGWGHRIGDVEQLAQLVSASQRVVVALVDNQLVGFARAITDGISNGYLSMVVVAAPFRRQGIGQALVDEIVGSEKTITWVLRAGRDGSVEFFKKLGFTESSIAMERTRHDPPL